MTLSQARWHVIAQSNFAWEREALDWLRSHLPDRDQPVIAGGRVATRSRDGADAVLYRAGGVAPGIRFDERCGRRRHATTSPA